MSGAVAGIPLALSVYIMISLRGRKMADVTAEGAGRNQAENKEEKQEKPTEKSDKTEFEEVDAASYL